MTRIGINPARQRTSEYVPARVTATMITYLPHLEGYFRHRFDVLRLSLSSLLANTRQPCDFLVFDNGSCAPVVDYLRQLRDCGALQYLVLSSSNIGKIGALQIIFDAAPGRLIAYADDDILFYPGWLDEQLRVLDAFPRAGMVSGAPVRNASTYAIQAVQDLIARNEEGVTFSRERFIPDAWEDDWAASTGRDPRAHRRAMQDKLDLVLESQGVKAVAGSNHFQFLAAREVLQQAMPDQWTGKLMGQMVELDNAVDRMGYLRLATTGRFARHIGNAISPQLAEDARQMGLDPGGAVSPPVRRRSWLLRLPGVRRILQALYGRLFNILNGIQ